MYQNILRAISKNPKTTIPALVGGVATLVSYFGFSFPAEVQTAIITLTLLVIGLLAGDGGKDVTIVNCDHGDHAISKDDKAASYTVISDYGKRHACSNHVEEMQKAPNAQVFKIGE